MTESDRLTIRWEGEVVGHLEGIKYDTVMALEDGRSEKIEGRWVPLRSATSERFLEMLHRDGKVRVTVDGREGDMAEFYLKRNGLGKVYTFRRPEGLRWSW